MATSEIVSVGCQLTWHAEKHPDEKALIFVRPDGAEQQFTWLDLDRRSNQLARLLASRGVDEHSTVVIGLPNSPEHVLSCYGVWKLGGMTLALSAAMPAIERTALIDLAEPDLIISDWEGLSRPNLSRNELTQCDRFDDGSLPDRLPHPGKALASGGSTGRPKIIVQPSPWGFVPGSIVKLFEPVGLRQSMRMLVPGPLYHEQPFSTLHWMLFEGSTVVLMERFDPELALDLIERHRVQGMSIPPIFMQRMLAVPNIDQRDLSSIETLIHATAPCPAWLKRAWFDLLGPDRVYEAWGGTEANGYTMIRGTDWLKRPGSVGKPYLAAVKILDDEGNTLPPGDVGNIYSRTTLTDAPTFRYVGSPPAPATSDGYTSIGDLGWLDDEGYLYLADRRTDLIISGGANVYPAEVEAALSEHPGVADVVVVGLPDETWGKRVHAITQPYDIDTHPSDAELNAWCRERLSAYKCPKTYEFIGELPRNEAGKIRRSALAAERAAQSLLGAA